MTKTHLIIKNPYLRLKQEHKLKKPKKTWRPAREEREVGFFLSLSLDWAGVLLVNNPFAPFPDIFSSKIQTDFGSLLDFL